MNRLLYYHMAIEKLEMQYQADIDKKQFEVNNLKVGCEIAYIYWNALTLVKGFIDNEIVPELSFIQAFLNSDSEEALTRKNLTSADAAVIREYKRFNREKLHKFIQNVHDFYTVVTYFCGKKNMSSLLKSGRLISEEEKTDFKYSVEALYEKLELVRSAKVSSK